VARQDAVRADVANAVVEDLQERPGSSLADICYRVTTEKRDVSSTDLLDALCSLRKAGVIADGHNKWYMEKRENPQVHILNERRCGLVPPLEMSSEEALNQLADCFVQRRLPAGAETLLKMDCEEARGKTQKNMPVMETKQPLKGAAFTKFLKNWAEHNSVVHQQRRKTILTECYFTAAQRSLRHLK
jgi:hypothetical protein